MNTEHLIRMANQIGAYYATEPDPEAARAGVADHIARFWEKRMRESLFDCLDSGRCDQLSPLVLEALTEFRERLLAKAS